MCVYNQDRSDKVKEKGGGSKSMKEFVETKPVDGEVRFLHSIDNSASCVTNPAGKNEETNRDSTFLPKLWKINNSSPTEADISNYI
jgi:hypothetical protein